MLNSVIIIKNCFTQAESQKVRLVYICLMGNSSLLTRYRYEETLEKKIHDEKFGTICVVAHIRAS